ncbi:unnamed protein product [Cuscuta campestris]|uniref:Uncharacterized protein n=1 Tax=Cuscuta campestris TaxID=132261 RepID=A0A484MES6_9ASTE|nr:unnamed protein product [Cuscuta campestris]
MNILNQEVLGPLGMAQNPKIVCRTWRFSRASAQALPVHGTEVESPVQKQSHDQLISLKYVVSLVWASWFEKTKMMVHSFGTYQTFVARV